jgi:WD40 repeat protein/predicted Ser/Thr protein kinase
MTSKPTDSLDRDQRLQDVVLAYLKAVDAGQTPDQQELLAQHADLADDLRAFFSGQHKIIAGMAPLRGILERESSPPFSRRFFRDYELLKEIGKGGMGIVYAARQSRPKRIVALKMIREGQLASPDDVSRFRSEAEIAATLDHPNIVPIYEVGEFEGQHYFTMKYIQGGSLAKHLRLFTHSTRASARLVAKLARAVHHGHQRGILHRDLKPANVLLDPRGRPHVTDFGLAKRVEGNTVITQTGAFVGTASYTSPEQAACKKQLTTAVDVYGLGTILYELLTGKPPFWAATLVETLRKVLELEPIRPRTLNSRLDRDLETICLKCLQKDPTKRYGSAEALAEDLEAWLAGEPIEARRAGVLERAIKWARRNPVLAGLATLLILVLTGAAIISSFFAVQAERQARETKKNADMASDEKNRADALALENDEHARELIIEKERADGKTLEAETRTKEVTDERELVSRLLYVSDLNLAQDEWYSGTNPRVLDLLNAQRPKPGQQDLRGFEWHYLWRRCHRDLHTLKGHNNQVWSVAYSPDGKYLASVSGGTTIIWDPISGKEVSKIEGGAGAHAMAYSPDGKWFASWIAGSVAVREVIAGIPSQTVRASIAGVTSWAFSGDGKKLVSGSLSLDAGTGTFKPIPPPWAPTLPSEEPLPANKLKPQKIKRSNAGEDWAARFMKAGFNPGSPQAFSPDLKYFASTHDHVIKIWDLTLVTKAHPTFLDIEPAITLDGHADWISGLAFGPNGTLLASLCRDGTVKIWDVGKGKEARTIKGRAIGLYHSVAFSPDGGRLAVANGSNEVKVWNPNTGEEMFTLKGTGNIVNIAFSPNGDRLATASWDKTVKTWDTTNGPETIALKGPPGTVHLFFSEDGSWLVSEKPDGAQRIWDAGSGREEIDHASIPRVPANRDKRLPDGMPGATSRDGKCRASVNQRALGLSQKITLWGPGRGDEPITLSGHADQINDLAFSSDGKRLASASRDKTVKIWDPILGRETLTLRAHKAEVIQVIFSSDGHRLASAGEDGEIKIWDATPLPES